MDEITPEFLKKFFIVMGIELVVALAAISYFLQTASFSHNKNTTEAPVVVFDPRGQNNSDSKVLGLETTTSPSPHVTIIITTPTPTPIPKRKAYKIALIGDSMEDTMGETGEYLQKALKTKYPDTNFLIYNYGKGSTLVTVGLEDFDHEFKYGIRDYPSVTDLKPDIIVIGSYANNPPNPYDRNWHWLTLSQLVQRAQKVTSNVYLLAEVAPLRANYGDGPNGVNWNQGTSIEHSAKVVELMENVLGLSKTLHVPLIDVFSATVHDGKYGKEGDPKDISVNDGIHPSQDGHELMANKIAETIKLN